MTLNKKNIRCHRLTTWVLCILLQSVFFSCVRSPLPEQEADIIDVKFEGIQFLRNPVITNTEIICYVNGWEDLKKIRPLFTLTPGATISPANGAENDFTAPQTYTVKSEDGKWSKNYKITFRSSEEALVYDFEEAKKHIVDNDVKYHILTYKTGKGNDMEWGSGNEGFMRTSPNAKPEDYPTSQSADGYQGKCVKLTTRSTGNLGILFKAPIAAGNLFLGTFKIDIGNPLKSTQMGVPFTQIPKALKGYYKYKAGEQFTDKDSKVIAGRKDSLDIYAVMYEVTEENKMLDGRNSKTADNIISIAQIQGAGETDVWKPFVIPFVNRKDKKIDPEKLKAGKYNLAIVLSSSRDGAVFQGAVGSTLYVDQLELFVQ